jgi:hypothetical protein
MIPPTITVGSLVKPEVTGRLAFTKADHTLSMTSERVDSIPSVKVVFNKIASERLGGYSLISNRNIYILYMDLWNINKKMDSTKFRSNFKFGKALDA